MKHKAFIEGCDIVNNNNNENFGHYSFIFSHGVNVQLITSENDEFTKSIARTLYLVMILSFVRNH